MKIIVPPQTVASANCWFWTAKVSNPPEPVECASCYTVATGRSLLQGL